MNPPVENPSRVVSMGGISVYLGAVKFQSYHSIRIFSPKAALEMGSRLDPALGGLRVEASGWYMSGGSLLSDSSVGHFLFYSN